jgi:dynactin 1
LSKQAENETLKKQSETLEHKLKILSKENEHVKNDMGAMQATIADLKEQVDTCLGAQQMVDILTTKNLSLEDQVRELQETVDNLVSVNFRTLSLSDRTFSFCLYLGISLRNGQR